MHMSAMCLSMVATASPYCMPTIISSELHCAILSLCTAIDVLSPIGIEVLLLRRSNPFEAERRCCAEVCHNAKSCAKSYA
jgi:hypothetical protein